eukprot:350105-Chlamydomonas_euryale.AAC.4
MRCTQYSTHAIQQPTACPTPHCSTELPANGLDCELPSHVQAAARHSNGVCSSRTTVDDAVA